MNSYVSVDLLTSSSVLDISATTDDTRLRLVVEAMSRIVDKLTNRHFFEFAQTRKFNGHGLTHLLIPDLISIDSSGLKTDDDVDRTFETTWATTDYLLQPPNADPTTRGNSLSRPYSKLLVDPAGDEDIFPNGADLVQIAGKWGWWKHLNRASETADAISSTTATSFSVSTRSSIEFGHTLLIDTEQIYVSSYSGNTLTVIRGVNGTTAATHSGGTAIDIYEYPGPIQEAVIILAARQWKRKDSAFASGVGFPDGSFLSFKHLDPDMRMLLSPYRKSALGN